jgi:TRAP-type mannitol/chloroaromatic compound transport system permease small subunit
MILVLWTIPAGAALLMLQGIARYIHNILIIMEHNY